MPNSSRLKLRQQKKQRVKAQRPTNAVATTTLTRSVKTSAGHQSKKFRGPPGINRVTIKTVKKVAATTITHARSQCKPCHDFYRFDCRFFVHSFSRRGEFH